MEARATDEEYLKNLEHADSIPYLSKKISDSNRETLKCISHTLCSLPSKILKSDNDTPLPFKLNIDAFNTSLYEKEEGDKDSIKINVNLVIFGDIIKLGKFGSGVVGKNRDLL